MRASIRGLRVAVIALAGYWVLLFISTHIPANALMAKLHQSDKVLHCGAFTCLAFLIAWAVPTNTARMMQNVWIAGVIAILYAGADELLQIPVGRTADWQDFWADCLGVCIGLVCYTAIRAALVKTDTHLLE
jgi:VanZ family protein